MFARAALLAAAALAPTAHAALYTMSDNWVGKGFLSAFQWQNISDPTHGRGLYVDQATALAENLTYASDNTFIMRADATTILKPTDPGRKTVRIRSWKTYREHVAVFDVRHMPQGCGTWPAAWETDEANWPAAGEVDIIEGANDKGPNAATLHTAAGCAMPAQRPMSGLAKSVNCDAAVDGNAGCGVSLTTSGGPNAMFSSGDNSYGPSFNAAGGGYYAMERTAEKILVWFWPRSGGAPDTVLSGAGQIETAVFGMPSASFPNTECDIESHFGAHNIIINLALCGDWAGSTYNADGCPGSCVDNANNNPWGFKDAYWDIAAIRVYETAATSRMAKRHRPAH